MHTSNKLWRMAWSRTNERRAAARTSLGSSCKPGGIDRADAWAKTNYIRGFASVGALECADAEPDRKVPNAVPVCTELELASCVFTIFLVQQKAIPRKRNGPPTKGNCRLLSRCQRRTRIERAVGVSLGHLRDRDGLVVAGVACLAELGHALSDHLGHGIAGWLQVIARIELLR